MKALPYESVKNRYEQIAPELTEKIRRHRAAIEAKELGYGGIAAVSRATGMTPETIRRGIKEISQGTQIGTGRQRKPGGGRKSLVETHPGIPDDPEKPVEPYSGGDPMRPLPRTCKSTYDLSDELKKQGYPVSPASVRGMLRKLGHSLQSNRKRSEGRQHPDRDPQSEYIATAAEEFQSRSCPVISADAKKKELVGNYADKGREWQKAEHPPEAGAYDFIDREPGKVTPYGAYDVTHNLGRVSVGTDNDTAQFAVRSIQRWWEELGERMYPDAEEILIMADGGGSNGWRNRLWKKSLQDWADKEGLSVMVCHFPPGTGRRNKIEHRMFCHITRNWRGRPLVSHEVIINLIGSTTTREGLRTGAGSDNGEYQKGIKVTDAETEALSVQQADFHGERNYLITPGS